jgi:hypothetical protein
MATKSVATKEIKDKRIKQVIEMLNNGKYRHEIVYDLSKEWNCSTRNVDKYLQASYKLLATNFDKNMLETLLSKYDFLYKRCLAKNDDKTATAILTQIAKITGVSNEKIEITGELGIREIIITEVRNNNND